MKNYMFVTAQVPSDIAPGAKTEFARELCNLASGYTVIDARGGWAVPSTLVHTSERVNVWHVGTDAVSVPGLIAALQRYLTAIGERAAYMVYPDGAASLIYAEDGERPAYPLSDVPTPIP